MTRERCTLQAVCRERRGGERGRDGNKEKCVAVGARWRFAGSAERRGKQRDRRAEEKGNCGTVRVRNLPGKVRILSRPQIGLFFFYTFISQKIDYINRPTSVSSLSPNGFPDVLDQCFSTSGMQAGKKAMLNALQGYKYTHQLLKGRGKHFSIFSCWCQRSSR